MRLSQSPSYLNDGNNTYDRYDKILYDENSKSSIGNRIINNIISDERMPSSQSSSHRPFDSPSSSALKSGYVRSLRSSFEPNNSSSSSSSSSSLRSSSHPSSSRTSRPCAIDVELPAVVASRQRDYRHFNIDRVPREDRTNDNRLKNEYAHSSQIIRGRHSHGGNVNLNSIQVDLPLPPSNAISTHQRDSINDSKKKKKAKKAGVKVDDYINHINSQRSASLSLSSSHSTSTSSFDTSQLVTRERYQSLFYKRQSQLEQRMKMQLYDLQQEQAVEKVGDRRVKKNYNNDPTVATATATANESSPSLLHKAIQERRFVPNNNSPTWMGLLEQKRNNNTLLLLLQESVVNEESAKNNVVNQSSTPRNGSLDIILPSSSSSRSPIIHIVDDRAWQGMGKTPTKLSKFSDDAAIIIKTGTEVEHKAVISKTTNDKKLLTSFVESNSNDKILPTYSSSSESESLMYSLGEDTDHSVDHEQRRLGMSLQSLPTAIQNASELFMSDDDSGAYGGGSGSYCSLPSTRSSRNAGGGWDDIVASTLAECKLLLNLSPLPSPAVVSKVNVHVKRSDLSPLSSPAVSKDNVERFDFRQRHNEQRAMANNPQRPSENANMSLQRSPFSISTMSIIATCPTCFKDFDMEGGDNMPLDSSTCEHIICRACILDMQAWTQLDKNTGISCPECGMKGSFDIIHQPTDSQESIGLVVTTIIESIKTKDMLQVESKIAMDDEDNRALVNDEINLNDVSIQNEFDMEKDQTGEETPHLLDTVVVNGYRPPLTPVSQAESHIIERRERLVQSFGNSNKRLDSVKQVRNENQPPTLTVHNHTTMVHEKEYVYVVPMTKNESRRMPQLRVDTGNEASPHAKVPQMVGGVINTARSIMSLFSPVQVSSFLIDMDKQKARSCKTELADNFSLEFPSPTEQTDRLSLELPSPITAGNICSYGDYNSLEFANAPESIEFDCFIAATMSNDSSLTDNDTISLLADKRQSKQLPEVKANKENHNRLKNVIGRGITCPQFLPSLKISTEQDHAYAFPGSSKNGEAQTARSAKGGGPIVCLREFVIRSFGFGDSPRHIEFSGGSSFSSSPDNKEEKTVDNDISGTFPTYEFSLHSCSMSPTLSQDDQFWQNNTTLSQDDQLWQNKTIEGGEGGDRIGDGSLVTHKPRRLHKKIMNTLWIKKSRHSFKKEKNV